MDRTAASDYVDIGGGIRRYRDENLAGGITGTALVALDRNQVQEEILGVIEAAGLTPSNADWAQLRKAIQKWDQLQPGNYAADAGTANAMVATLAPVPASLAALAGVPIRIKKISSANSGAVTLNVNALGAVAVTWPDGTALTAGELPAGAILEVHGTGTAFVLAGPVQRPVMPADAVLSGGNPGWAKLPSGLIIQWTQITVGTSGTTWTYPRSFPTFAGSVMATPVSGGSPGTDDVIWVVGTPTPSSAAVDARTTSAIVAYLTAIGY